MRNFYRQAAPSNLASQWSPHSPSSKISTIGAEGKPKIRVGFASKVLLSDHSISRLLRSTICSLASRFRSSIEVFVIVLDPHMSPAALLKYRHKLPLTEEDPVQLVEGGGTLESARNAVLRANLDVLVYPAIGMDFVSALLANMRLAQIQGVCHPESTGSSEIDVFFTAKLAEANTLREEIRPADIAIKRTKEPTRRRTWSKWGSWWVLNGRSFCDAEF